MDAFDDDGDKCSVERSESLLPSIVISLLSISNKSNQCVLHAAAFACNNYNSSDLIND